jgi:hypothetical protein
MEQTGWVIAVEYRIDIDRCIDGAINGESVAAGWL